MSRPTFADRFGTYDNCLPIVPGGPLVMRGFCVVPDTRTRAHEPTDWAYVNVSPSVCVRSTFSRFMSVFEIVTKSIASCTFVCVMSKDTRPGPNA